VGTLNMKHTASFDTAALRKVLGWTLLVALGATVAASLTLKAVAQTVPQAAAPAVAVSAPAVTPTTNPAPVPASTMAHSCAACHGTHGQLGDEAFVPLAGMPVAQFVRTMRDFRDNKRPATLMGHVARGFTDADLQGMGAFFAAQKPLAGTATAAHGAKP
jgi:sulfide dehydrogenase cytochrome subunit